MDEIKIQNITLSIHQLANGQWGHDWSLGNEGGGGAASSREEAIERLTRRFPAWRGEIERHFGEGQIELFGVI